MIKIHIPRTRGSATRYGSSQIIFDNSKNCVVIDGGEGNLSADTLAYLKAQGITHLTLIVTHWHYDHYYGARQILDASFTIVDEIICNPPEEVQGSALSSGEKSAAKSFVARAKALGKAVTYLPSKTVVSKTVGDINMRLWRVAYYKVSSDEYASVNNTSIAAYFPDLYYVTCADMGDDQKNMLNAFNSTVRVFEVPHHGNACPQSVTQAFKNKGAKLCWYNDLGNINTSGFLAYGARRCKQAGLVTLNTDSDIDMTANNGKLTVVKGSQTYTYEVPYMGYGWIKDENGWWYKYEDGSYPKSQWLHLDKWYYFNERGYAVTGWQKINWRDADHWFYFGSDCRMRTGWVKTNDNWYYLDPTSGVMLTGWIQYDNRLFYLEENTANNLGHCYTSRTAQIGGKSYQFDANGVATEITAEEEETESADPYTIAVDRNLKQLNGIDIASYQSGLNVANLGNSTHFVIVKATQGTSYVNPCCNKHYAQAKATGRLLGLYHYANGTGAVKEADYFVKNIKNYIGEAILVLDWEGNQNSQFGKSDVTYVKTFCDRVYELTKVRPLVYMSKSVCRAHNWASVSADYALWSAQYANTKQTGYQTSPWTDSKGFGAWSSDAIRQYTSSLVIDGYSGRLDGDLAYMGVESWLKFAKGDRT